MGLFKKNKNKIPEISKNQALPPSPTITKETPTSPPTIAPQTSTPHPQIHLAQPHYPELPRPTIAPQAPISQPTIIEHPKVAPHSLPRDDIPSVTMELNHRNESNITSEQPFFVRIDKFSETKENFHRINEKMKEMEKILNSLEATKNEEEKELDLWKQDMDEMKSLLRNIDKEIFNKI